MRSTFYGIKLFNLHRRSGTNSRFIFGDDKKNSLTLLYLFAVHDFITKKNLRAILNIINE